jgi:hypothetical protein
LLNLLAICLLIINLFLEMAAPLKDNCAEPSLLELTNSLSYSLKGDGPRGAEALSAVERLPNFQEDSLVKQFSSNDPSGGNVDAFNFLYRESNGEYVILEESGPAVIYNSWMTSLPGGGLPGGNIRFYFDGARTPAIDLPVASFFDGTASPFTEPLAYTAAVGNANGCFRCKSTYYNYYPVSFQKSLKITLQNVPGYFHFYLRKYASPLGITTYNGKEDLSRTRQQWSRLGDDPKTISGNTGISGQKRISNDGRPVVLLDEQRAGTINAISLLPDRINLDILLNFKIQIFWDDDTVPSVDVPIGYFFGGGVSLRPFRSLMAGMPDNGRWYNYFPMPYWKNARVQLINSTSAAVNVDFEIKTGANLYRQGEAGYFKGNFKQTTRTTTGTDWRLLESKGRGHIVGVVMSTALTGDKDSWWEGDERFYIDGSRSPQINGTGTEDFFNMAYEPNSRWISPLVGTVSESTSNEGTPDRDMVWYRWLLADNISFQSSITAGFEIGPQNDVAASDRRAAIFWYGSSETASNVTDTMRFGDNGDEKAHNYRVSGQTFRDKRTLTYLGDGRLTQRLFEGVGFTGQSEFSVKVRPDAKAVILRRRLDFGTGNQVSDVYVNGNLAGRWYERGSVKTPEWRDSEFLIPSYLTRGLDTLNIQVRFVSSDKEWNEFGYEVLSLGKITSTGLCTP